MDGIAQKLATEFIKQNSKLDKKTQAHNIKVLQIMSAAINSMKTESSKYYNTFERFKDFTSNTGNEIHRDKLKDINVSKLYKIFENEATNNKRNLPKNYEILSKFYFIVKNHKQ